MSTTRRLFAPTPASSLACFRIAFGLILCWEVGRYFQHGWISEYFVEPRFHFHYAGFGWVAPLPAAGLRGLFVGLGVCAAGIATGYRLRLAASLFCLGFSYVFLLEKARYLNHFYLVILLCGLLAVAPADRVWSMSAWRRRKGRQRAGSAVEGSVPAWSLALLRTQFGLVYLFAGLAKLNEDWLRARPLTDWLGSRQEHAVLGPLLQQDWSPWLFSYGGLALDLAAWPLLIWKRTRGFAFLLTCAFHLTNASLFGIGIFPWTMIAGTALFLDPDGPRRLLRRWTQPSSPPRSKPLSNALSEAPSEAPPGARQRLVLWALGIYLGLQVLIPLRHFAYPGPVSWTEEGHSFSWHMKLRSKRSETSFRLRNGNTGEEWLVNPAAELTDWQTRKMSGRPDMILQYGQHLGRRLAAESGDPIEVRVASSVSLNSRPPQALIDPARDIMDLHWGWSAAPWIVPLRETSP